MKWIDRRHICLVYQYLTNGIHPDSRELPSRRSFHTTIELALLLDCDPGTVLNNINNDNFEGVVFDGKSFLVPDWSYLKYFRGRYNGQTNIDFEAVPYEGFIKMSVLMNLLECDRTAIYYHTGILFRKAKIGKRLPFLNISSGMGNSLRFPWRSTLRFFERELPDGYLDNIRSYGLS